MNDKQRLDFQDRQIQILQEEKTAALEALDLARTMGTFAVDSQQKTHTEQLTNMLQEICLRVHQMLPLEAVSIYLVDEVSYDFIQALTTPEEAGTNIEKEVQGLIADQSFAFAIQSDMPVFFLDETQKRHLILHPIATPSRTRGMLVGLMAEDKANIMDTTLKLFSVIMLSAAHALENLEIQNFMRNHSQELERKVQSRTQDLVEAHDRISKTINGMQAGVVLIDASTKTIVEANPSALEMLGGTLNEVVGSKCYNHLCPATEDLCPVLDNALETENSERVLISKDGKKIPIQKTVSKVMLNDKPHLVESFIDLTQQKKLLELKEDVDRIMRHDLKSPLNGIIGLPEIMLDEGGLTDDQRENLEFIKGAGHKLLNIINMSLDIYKMETDSYIYSPTNHDLLPIIRTILRDQATQISSKNMKVQILTNGRPVEDQATFEIPCEELLTYSLFSNLIKNAVEASPAHATLSLDILKFAETTLVDIHNYGAVPEKIRETIFDKYVTGGKLGGTGLGTYSARLITNTMGGTIECTSSEENGTNMILAFPNFIEDN